MDKQKYQISFFNENKKRPYEPVSMNFTYSVNSILYTVLLPCKIDNNLDPYSYQ